MELIQELAAISGGLLLWEGGLLVLLGGIWCVTVKPETVLKLAGLMTLTAEPRTIRRLRQLVEPRNITTPLGCLLVLLGLALMGLGSYTLKLFV